MNSPNDLMNYRCVNNHYSTAERSAPKECPLCEGFRSWLDPNGPLSAIYEMSKAIFTEAHKRGMKMETFEKWFPEECNSIGERVALSE